MTTRDTINPPDEPERTPTGWHRFRDQMPAVIVTAVLVIVAVAIITGRSARREEAALAPLREQNEALRAQADDNRRQIEATAQLLREAIGKHEGELFKTDVEIQKLNDQRISALASAIAQKVVPALPGPKSPEELARLEDEQVDRISSRTAEKLEPAFASLGRKQESLTGATITGYNDRIRHLDADLQATQAAAQDALKYSHELSALYLDSFKDHGVLVRILSLPAEVVRDTATGNLVTGRDRRQAEQTVDRKLQELEKRLNEIRTHGATGSPVAAN